MSVTSKDVASISAETAQDAERRGLHLLVVDDDASQQALISVAAKQAGHAVTVVATCAGAIDEIRSNRFDCVTLDLSLEDGDGTGVLKAIAEAKFTGSIVVISGVDSTRRSAARLYARSLGIDLHSLPKPIDMAALRIFLANLAKTTLGLPVVHTWGGVAADRVAAKHRV
ncbi:MAG: response regulator [Bradyrhizobium sp.]|jgi:two-component system, chemotaxis family, chemotaxis protein CheY|uniref:response regulator n=1 Tax=Bradyrhizobium sp. TaxID=376 RepID=UPI003C7CFD20